MPGAGKTTVGRILAEKLGMGFCDTDEEIEKIAGESPEKIIEKYGEERFREIETEVAETVSGGHYHNNIAAQYSGNVLICGDYALEYFSVPAAGNAGYAAMVNAFAAKYPTLNVSCALVPKSCAFHAPIAVRTRRIILPILTRH